MPGWGEEGPQKAHARAVPLGICGQVRYPRWPRPAPGRSLLPGSSPRPDPGKAARSLPTRPLFAASPSVPPEARISSRLGTDCPHPHSYRKEREATGNDHGSQVSICTLFTRSCHLSSPCVRARVCDPSRHRPGPKTIRLRTPLPRTRVTGASAGLGFFNK
ncbi:hypothetical protein HJG60_011636 [Phyllostomus discolor]|uniref:Uncharacterized protein n=1 Tax=Phyllostomus discolor TaxID=89673 RepID=A0A833ZN39_9CHIR|nr:hypothetical protein HJG60_011636 [Phyllostomus discolor]